MSGTSSPGADLEPPDDPDDRTEPGQFYIKAGHVWEWSPAAQAWAYTGQLVSTVTRSATATTKQWSYVAPSVSARELTHPDPGPAWGPNRESIAGGSPADCPYSPSSPEGRAWLAEWLERSWMAEQGSGRACVRTSRMQQQVDDDAARLPEYQKDPTVELLGRSDTPRVPWDAPRHDPTAILEDVAGERWLDQLAEACRNAGVVTSRFRTVAQQIGGAVAKAASNSLHSNWKMASWPDPTVHHYNYGRQEQWHVEAPPATGHEPTTPT